jgi:hypothetical protein
LRFSGGEAGIGGLSGAWATGGFDSGGIEVNDEGGGVASVVFSVGRSRFSVLIAAVFLVAGIFGASLLRGELAFFSKGDVGAVLGRFTAFDFFGVSA